MAHTLLTEHPGIVLREQVFTEGGMAFGSSSEKEIVREIKEKMCYVALVRGGWTSARYNAISSTALSISPAVPNYDVELGRSM